MTNAEIRYNILKILYEVCESDGIYGFMDIDDLVAKIPVDENIIEREFDFLFDEGLVDRPALGFVTITPQGINKVENSPEFGISHAFEEHKIEVHSGRINQTSQDHINNPTLFLKHLAGEIEKSTQIEREKKESWVKVLLDMSNNPWAAEILKKLLFLSV